MEPNRASSKHNRSTFHIPRPAQRLAWLAEKRRTYFGVTMLHILKIIICWTAITGGILGAVFALCCGGLPEHRNACGKTLMRRTLLVCALIIGIAIAVLLTGCRVPGVDQHEHPPRPIQIWQ